MSKITDIFKQLSHGSLGAVQNGCQLNELAEYLNVDRLIEVNLKKHMDAIKQNGGGLVLLIGNAGDGKSHIISKLKNTNDYNDFEFYNDATASCSPNMSSIETLKIALRNYDDQHIKTTSTKTLLAINLGKLNDFVDDENFSEIGNLAKQVLSDHYESINQTDYLRFVSFSNQQNFELTQDGSEYPVESSFISEILNKITKADCCNPFYAAYEETKKDSHYGAMYPEVLNFEILSLLVVKKSIVMLIIECMVRFQLIFTPRDFFDFVCSIIVFPFSEKYNEGRHLFESLLPSLIFSGNSSKIQKMVCQLDPLRVSSLDHNKSLAVMFTAYKLHDDMLDKNKLSCVYESLKEKINFYYKNHGKDTERISKFIFRVSHLLDYHSESDVYRQFLRNLSLYNNEESRNEIILELEEKVDLSIPRHYGAYTQVNDLIPLNIQGSKYRLFARIDKSMSSVDAPYIGQFRNEFLLYIPMQWVVKNNPVELKMDYQLFEYICSLEKGKLPITYESELNMEFSRFIRELIKYSSGDKEVVIISSDEKTVCLRSKLNNVVTLS